MESANAFQQHLLVTSARHVCDASTMSGMRQSYKLFSASRWKHELLTHLCFISEEIIGHSHTAMQGNGSNADAQSCKKDCANPAFSSRLSIDPDQVSASYIDFHKHWFSRISIYCNTKEKRAEESEAYPVKKKITTTDMIASPMNFSRSLHAIPY